jgi:hypothetical protein
VFGGKTIKSMGVSVPNFNRCSVMAALNGREGTPLEYVTRTSVASISVSF